MVVPASFLRSPGNPGCQRLGLSAHSYPGCLISVCGVDGSGKSTMIEAIQAEVTRRGGRSIVVQVPSSRMRRDPAFRAMVDADAEGTRVDVDLPAICMALLGDLRQELTETVEPRLRQGEVVICDRYIYTHLAEVIARSSNPHDAELITQLAHRFTRPDLAIFMDVSVELAAERVLARGKENDRPPHPALAQAQIQAYRAVAAANGLLWISSEQPVAACVEVAARALIETKTAKHTPGYVP